MKPDITELALLDRDVTLKDRLRAALWMFFYGGACTLGLFASCALLVFLFDFLPKVARLFYTTYIGG